MPDDIKVNDLPITPIVNDTDTVMIVQNNIATKQTSLGDIGNHIIQDKNYSELNTQNKHIIDAINEVKGVELFGVLPAGETTITFKNAAIKTTSKVIPFVEVWGVAPKSVETYSGMVQMKFRKLDYDLNIQLVIQ